METYNEVLTTQLKIFRRKAENVSLKAENDEKTIFFEKTIFPQTVSMET